MLTFDGQAASKSTKSTPSLFGKVFYPVKMITLPGQHYFDVLKAKLRWSGGRI